MRAARAIQAATCEHFRIDQGDLLGARRYRELVRARHLAMFLCRQRLGLSYPELGIAFGNRDHTSVIYACSNIRQRLDLEPVMRAHLRSVETLLEGGHPGAEGAGLPPSAPADPAPASTVRIKNPCERDNAAALEAEVRRLTALLNTPQTTDWVESVKLEAAHQRERWGTDGEIGKSPAEWFWLLGYLGGKALHAAVTGNTEKALHHTISAGAALANWHAALSGTDTRMRPGIAEEARP